MGCTSPLYRVPIGSKNFNLLTAYDQNRLKNHGVFLRFEALEAYKNLPTWNSDEVQILRCGQCKECRLNYSKDWAIRCSLEASLHEHNYWITLTYSEECVPRGTFLEYDRRIVDTNLVRRDIQLFIKRLREYERELGNPHVKVLYAGEYGDINDRPHFHLILFGASEIPDLNFHHQKGKYKYYKSPTYEKLWSTKINGVDVLRGFVDISEATFDNMAYTARYCLKKIKGLGKKEFLEYYNSLEGDDVPELRTQPFIGMSLKPGIAAEYYEKNKGQVYLEDLVKYQKKYELYRAKPPRYFDKLFERDEPDEFRKVTRKRKLSGVLSRKQRYKLYSEPELDRLNREAKIVEAKERAHVRSL